MSGHARLEALKIARQAVTGDTFARRRLDMLFDPGSFTEIDCFAAVDGEPCGVVCGFGRVNGSPVYAFSQDITAQAGGVGTMHGAKIAKVYDLALKTGAPVVGIYDSLGARVSEGVAALSAFGELLLRVNNLSGVVPQVALVLGHCAGAGAMLACSADFVVMSNEAKLWPGGQANGNAVDTAAAGVAHMVMPDDTAACAAVRRLLSLLPLNNLAAPPACDYAEPNGEAVLTAACQGDIADQDPAAISRAIFDADSVIELLPAFGSGAFTAMATLSGMPVGVAATHPGKLDADDCAKLAKVVSVLDSFQIPVVTFVNTAGFAPDEPVGSVREMAKLAHVYAEATTPKVAVVTGEAYGAAYVALCSRAANADYTVAWPSAILSPLSPAATIAFLHSDEISPETSRARLEADYIAGEASPLAAAAGGYIDDVIDPAHTRRILASAMDILSAKRVSRHPKKHSNIPL